MSSIDEQVQKLKVRLEKINSALKKIANEIASTSETSNIFWAKINREIKYWYDEARKITKEWANGSVPAIYADSVKEEIVRIKNKKLPAPKRINMTDFESTHTFKQSSASLLGETLSTFGTGYLSGERTMRRLASLTQQVNLSEKEVNKAVADGFLEKGSARGSKKKLQQELLKKSLDGKYITIIDKNGKSVQWGIDTYSELVALVKLHEASTQGVINVAAAVGGDLIQVSVHNTTCEICAEFEGKIYSLSGGDKDFPSVEELPPFHPHCKHSTSIVFREALEQQGTLQEYIDFSNGEQEEHPTRRSFIPVSQRELH